MKVIQLNIQEAEAENLLQVQSQSDDMAIPDLPQKQNKTKKKIILSVKVIANFVLLH